MTDRLYHGTSEEGARSILRDGLLTEQDRGIPRPTDAEFEDISEPYLWDGVWLATSPERARDFGSVVLVVDARAIPAERFYEVFEEDVCIVGSIGADLIERGTE